MYKISNSNIYLTRGDSAKLWLTVTDSSEQAYDFSEDTVVMTVKHSCTDKQALIQKTFEYDSSTGKASVEFVPEDTQNLAMGDYVYDVQLTRAEDGAVDTIVTPHTFTLGTEVTW